MRSILLYVNLKIRSQLNTSPHPPDPPTPGKSSGVQDGSCTNRPMTRSSIEDSLHRFAPHPPEWAGFQPYSLRQEHFQFENRLSYHQEGCVRGIGPGREMPASWEEHFGASERRLFHSEEPSAARPWTPKAIETILACGPDGGAAPKLLGYILMHTYTHNA